MKRIMFLTFSVAMFVAIGTFVSCSSSSSDDEGPKTQVSKGKVDPALVGTWANLNEGYSYTFNANGTGYYTERYGSESISWGVENDILTVVYDGDDDYDSYYNSYYGSSYSSYYKAGTYGSYYSSSEDDDDEVYYERFLVVSVDAKNLVLRELPTEHESYSGSNDLIMLYRR